jgi:hypothetical protein
VPPLPIASGALDRVREEIDRNVRRARNGIKLAVFYTKIYNRLFIPPTAANQPQAPRALRHALRTLDHHVDDYIARARLKPTV